MCARSRQENLSNGIDIVVRGRNGMQARKESVDRAARVTFQAGGYPRSGPAPDVRHGSILRSSRRMRLKGSHIWPRQGCLAAGGSGGMARAE